jgi:hypothetical protein
LKTTALTEEHRLDVSQQGAEDEWEEFNWRFGRRWVDNIKMD